MNEAQKSYLTKLVTLLSDEVTNNKQENIEVLVRAISDIAIFKKDVNKVMLPLGLTEKL